MFRRTVVRWLLRALAVAIAAGVLVLIDPSLRLLFRVASILGTVLFVVSVVVMLLTFRKARGLEALPLVVTALLAVATTTIFFAFAGPPLGRLVVMLAVLAGLVVGIAWSTTGLVFVEGRLVRTRGTLWFLAVWALTLALPQILAAAAGRTPATAAVAGFVGMGLTIGNAGGLIARARAARAGLAASTAPPREIAS